MTFSLNDMNKNSTNVDAQEVAKFDSLAERWWDPEGEFKPLHDINPLRLQFIVDLCKLKGLKGLDVGCGGGILTESLVSSGADMTGIDMAERVLGVAKLHQLESGLKINYQQSSVEDFAEQHPESFDFLTCMELLEHVPQPHSTIKACAELVKPGAFLFFSTLNRNLKSYLLAIIGAEYVLNWLPKGTHDYQKFIKPSELSSWARAAGLELVDMKGMVYNPLTKQFKLSSRDLDVNYLVCFQKKS